jgi:serine/threonine protein kinase
MAHSEREGSHVRDLGIRVWQLGGNNSVFGAPKTWVWTKHGIGIEATYRRGRPKQPDSFFSVIWQLNGPRTPGQVNEPKWDCSIRLEVEAPRDHENSSLNALKCEVVSALLNSDLRRKVVANGYGCDERRVMTSDVHIQNHRTTTLFKVILPEGQTKATAEENIEAVHNAVGSSVDAVLQRFAEKLKEQFGQPKQGLVGARGPGTEARETFLPTASSVKLITVLQVQFGKLAQSITGVVSSDPLWRIVSATPTLVRAIPSQLEDALPAIGSSANAPGSAWLTLDFWIDDRPRPRLGVFWRSNPVKDREVRNRVIRTLLESPTGFEYKGKAEAWIEKDEPAFSGRTVSNQWWPSGEEPDLHAASDEIRDQLRTWTDRLPGIVNAVRASSTGRISEVQTVPEDSPEVGLVRMPEEGSRAAAAMSQKETLRSVKPKAKDMVTIGKLRISRDKLRGYVKTFEENGGAQWDKSMKTWWKNKEATVREILGVAHSVDSYESGELSAAFRFAIENKFPYPIAKPFYQLRGIYDSSGEVNQLANILGVTLEHLALIALAEYLSGEARNEDLSSRLSEALKKPISHGTWAGLLRDLLTFSKDRDETGFVRELHDSYFPVSGKGPSVSLKAISDDLVQIRNELIKRSSDALPPLDRYRLFKRQLVRFLQAISFLKDYQLISVAKTETKGDIKTHLCFLHMGFHDSFAQAQLQCDLDLQKTRVAMTNLRTHELMYLYPFCTVDRCPQQGCGNLHWFRFHKTDGCRIEYLASNGHKLRDEAAGVDLANLLTRPSGTRLISKARYMNLESEGAQQQLSEGQVIDGKYKIVKHLRRGGMADLYEVLDISENELRALKLLPFQFISDRSVVQRFRQEAVQASQFEHPNITRVLGHGESLVDHYLVMELATGWELTDGRLGLDAGELPKPLPTGACVSIIKQACEGLDYIHASRVIHRDIKPANILLFEGSIVKLSDFGIARSSEAITLTLTGLTMGTPEYSSPEQVEGKRELTFASDVYSLGVVMFELLTGTSPFKRATPMASAFAHLLESVPDPRSINPALPVQVSSIVIKCLQKDPTQRYATARALLSALDKYERLQSTGETAIDEFVQSVRPRAQNAVDIDGARHMLRQIPNPSRQRDLLTLLYQAGDKGLTNLELAAKMNCSRKQVADALGVLGSLIKRTEGLSDKRGFSTYVEVLFDVQELTKSDWHFKMKPVLQRALAEEGFNLGYRDNASAPARETNEKALDVIDVEELKISAHVQALTNSSAWGLTFGSAPGTAAMRINCQLCGVPKTISEICAGTANDRWGPTPVTEARARAHLHGNWKGNSGAHPEHRSVHTFVSGLLRDAQGRYYLPASMKPDRSIPIQTPGNLSDQFTDFWRQYWEVSVERAPLLAMAKPGPKQAGSTWIYFKPSGLPRGVTLVHKLALGRVDLHLPGASQHYADVLTALGPLLDSGMELERAGKSVAIRLTTPKINMSDDFDGQREHVVAGLDAAIKLLEWARRHATALDEITKGARGRGELQ